MNEFSMVETLPKDTYWVSTHADEAQIFLDGEEYFKSLYENIRKAQKTLYFLGWDFDSRLEFLRFRQPEAKRWWGKEIGRYPSRFGPLLRKLASDRPDLKIYILAWDFATYYLPMRELFQKVKFQWRAGANIHFTFDGLHPLGASHHQKIVVVDDELAYCGGFDITSKRWDSSEHLPRDPRRRAPDGTYYAPFHDVAVAVRGGAAEKLGELCRERLSRVMRRRKIEAPHSPSRKHADFILRNVLHDLPAVISRTSPTFRGNPGVREIERLYIEQIKNARDYIYIENQYLTAQLIVTHLERRLREANGPKMLIVLPKKQSDPVSKYTMGVLTERAIKRLRVADVHDHLFIGYPEVPGLNDDDYENVHSKVIAIDDQMIRIGSSNLNNRSMGLDTECDVTLFAGNSLRQQKAFRREIARMIANHYDCDRDHVFKVWNDVGMDVRELAVRLSNVCERRLQVFDSEQSWSPLAAVADLEFVDLDRAASLEIAADHLLRQETGSSAGEFFRTVPVGLLLAVVSCFFFAWAKLNTDWLNPLLAMDPLPMSAVFCSLAGVSLLPFSAVVALIASIFGYKALWYLIPGTAFAVLVGYTGGLLLSSWKQLPGRWLPLVQERLEDGGFWSAFWARFFPFAPFAVVNMVCGRNRNLFSDYFYGSVLGITPFLVFVTAFQTELIDYLSRESFSSLLLMLAITCVVLFSLRVIRRRYVASRWRDVN